MPLHWGVFWVFAVRPTTPQEIYPHRYLAAPQPPEGPRMWGYPLAVLQWERETLAVTADCRQPFDNLVELTKHQNGCCEFTVGKRGTYPDLVRAFADIAAKKMGSVGLCLLPDPPVHKLNGLIKLHHEPQMRVEISGSGPMTMLEIEGGGFDVIGVRAFALEKLHIRLMDEASLIRVQHCESLKCCAPGWIASGQSRACRCSIPAPTATCVSTSCSPCCATGPFTNHKPPLTLDETHSPPPVRHHHQRQTTAGDRSIRRYRLPDIAQRVQCRQCVSDTAC